MGFTADDLFETLLVCSDGAADEPADMVALVREEQPVYVATLFSAWEAEGRELSPALKLELEASRERVEFYRALHAEIAPRFPRLTWIKGLEIGALYPDGLCRHQNDLDYIASDEEDLWALAAWLVERGWDIRTATFNVFDGRPHVMVSVRLPHPTDPFRMYYGIEIMTYFSQGNFIAVGPLLSLREEWRTPPVKNLLMLLYERYEQKYRPRDLLDAVLLHEALTGDELSILHDAVAELDLGVEYSEMIRMVAKSPLGELPHWPGQAQVTASVRARRLARGTGHFIRPLSGMGRHLQRRVITAEITKPELALWDAIQTRLPVPTALNAGLMAFGLPLEGPEPDVSRTVLHRRGNLAWADTPHGRFLLTLGDNVSQEDIDLLSSLGT